VSTPVSCDSFAKGIFNVIAGETPNVVGVISRNNDSLAQLQTRTIPFDDHDRPFISDALNLVDMAINHGAVSM
jgi:hypothetical protein